MLQVRKHSGTFLALQQRGKSDTLDRVQPGPDRQAAGLTSLSHVELVSAARLQLGGAQGGNLKRGDRRERKLQAVMKQFISISKIKCEADPPVLSLWIWKKKKLSAQLKWRTPLGSTLAGKLETLAVETVTRTIIHHFLLFLDPFFKGHLIARLSRMIFEQFQIPLAFVEGNPKNWDVTAKS